MREELVERNTNETRIVCKVNLDKKEIKINTGIPFFDHMISQLAKHAGISISLDAKGDLDVDLHHLVEDVGLCLGEAINGCLGDKKGISRFGSSLVPLDEALVQVGLDLSGRPYLSYDLELPKEVFPLGNPPFDPQLAEEFWRAFSNAGALCVHFRFLAGKNTHHILEASFKAFAVALRQAISPLGNDIPSTKGKL